MGKHSSLHKKKKKKHRARSSSSDRSIIKNNKKVKNSCEKEQKNAVPVCASNNTKNVVKLIGPVMIVNDKNEYSKSTETFDSLKNDMYGPALPPSLTNPTKNCATDSKRENLSNGSSEEDIIGPLPPSHSTETSDIQIQLNKRAEALNKIVKHKEAAKRDRNKRESWMLELPEEKSAKLGLSTRKFKQRDSGDTKNRSLWTETPNDESSSSKEIRDNDETEEFQDICLKQRDEAMDEMIKNCKKQRTEKSLLEIHRESMNKKKHVGTKERRPFDRDIDLQTNRFDEAQKKSIIKKAQHLDTRFSQGQSKYL